LVLSRNFFFQCEDCFMLQHINSGWFKSHIMTNNANRAEKIMDNLERVGKISECGSTWLQNAMDPHPDIVRDYVGMPTGLNTPTVTVCKKFEFDIKKPAALAAGNWTCHIFSLPFAIPQTFVTTSGTAWIVGSTLGNFLPSPAVDATNFNLGFINVMAALDGADLGVFEALQTTLVRSISLDPNEFKGDFRIVGAGYEVCNTTSELYVQGMSTHYRAPQTFEKESCGLCTAAGVYKFGGVSGVKTNQPPSNAGQALNYPGSLQWKAKEGNYTTIPLVDIENPMDQQSEGRMPYFFLNDGFNIYYKVPCSKPLATITGQSPWSALPTMLVKTATVGSYYTGLSDQTTLTLKVNIYVERAPIISDASEATLVSVARAACPRDTFALALYSHAIRDMPVSTVFRNNGLGKWFLDSMMKIADFAAPTLSLIPHPVAQAAAAGIKGGLPILQKFAQDRNKAKAQAHWGGPKLLNDNGVLIKEEKKIEKKIRKRAQKQGRKLAVAKAANEGWGVPASRQYQQAMSSMGVSIPERNRINAARMLSQTWGSSANKRQ